MHNEAKVFARVALRPGSMAPLHKHEGSFETFYILAGEGLVDDNGTMAEVKVGDVVFTDDGESHSIKNTGATDLEYIALVIKHEVSVKSTATRCFAVGWSVPRRARTDYFQQ